MKTLNPSPVPIRLETVSGPAYGILANLLREAATTADDVASSAATNGHDGQAADWRAVRDALRQAATEALVPRGGTGRPRCRRCGVDCPSCGRQDRRRVEPYAAGSVAIGWVLEYDGRDQEVVDWRRERPVGPDGEPRIRIMFRDNPVHPVGEVTQTVYRVMPEFGSAD